MGRFLPIFSDNFVSCRCFVEDLSCYFKILISHITWRKEHKLIYFITQSLFQNLSLYFFFPLHFCILSMFLRILKNIVFLKDSTVARLDYLLLQIFARITIMFECRFFQKKKRKRKKACDQGS